MLAVKVKKREAEETKQKLRLARLLAEGVSACHDDEFVYFPVIKKTKGFTHCDKKFDEKPLRAKPLKKALEGKLAKKELQLLKQSFDSVGTIAILEIPRELEGRQKIIAETLLAANKKIETVLKKSSVVEGEYRVRKLAWLAGKKTFTAVYRESGCAMRISLDKAYFSPRLSGERLRIAGQVREGENVLALFAGVGPYALVIARKQPKANVTAIELNPDAVKQMRENVALNKLKNIEVIKGDVRKILPARFRNWADRATMPLPHTGENFLECVLPAVRKGGTIHFYGFGSTREGNPFKVLETTIKKECRKAKRKCRIVGKRIVRPYAPKVVQVGIDFKMD